MALAGSGKTTTLLRFTEKNPKLNFLLVVYNRAVADDAKMKFPTNVTCKTVHELASHHLIRKNRGRFSNKRTGQSIFPLDLMEKNILRHDRRGIKRYQREQLVLDTLNRFWSSADECITVDHTPAKIMKWSKEQETSITEKILSQQEREVCYRDYYLVLPNHFLSVFLSFFLCHVGFSGGR